MALNAIDSLSSFTVLPQRSIPVLPQIFPISAVHLGSDVAQPKPSEKPLYPSLVGAASGASPRASGRKFEKAAGNIKAS